MPLEPACIENTATELTFGEILDQQGLNLKRGKTATLQINTGFLCNQACRHCHLEAGPLRTEVMDRQTMEAVISHAQKVKYEIIDITGGAPEMVPDIDFLMESLRPLCGKLLFRSNLTALFECDRNDLLELMKKLKVSIISSFPSTNEGQTASQRGKGVFANCLIMLKKLNRNGYGKEGSGLELNLVANPSGAFLPVSQCSAEKQFKRDLARKWDITFNNLYTFANMPLGRFKSWLLSSGNYDQYMKKLRDNFNPETIDGLMCRSLISVGWDGTIYDCDFNQAAALFLGGSKQHVADFTAPPPEGTPIAIGDHCFACTAGAGFT
ncbi:MAG: arsenosugar biosynthesis radical SAM protein ArsS [Proteobacteria bacterium]|nr:arsenosugar biosynthesis radical SAM protein ArsS [Pseudomonadota bacterium]MBU1709897.1 arsenosugar biosynthesis radical SAM protein ArsS [Pseudomonadota bacterium]